MADYLSEMNIFKLLNDLIQFELICYRKSPKTDY